MLKFTVIAFLLVATQTFSQARECFENECAEMTVLQLRLITQLVNDSLHRNHADPALVKELKLLNENLRFVRSEMWLISLPGWFSMAWILLPFLFNWLIKLIQYLKRDKRDDVTSMTPLVDMTR